MAVATSGAAWAAPPAAVLRLVSPVQPFGVFFEQVAAIAGNKRDGSMTMEIVTPRVSAVIRHEIAHSALPDVFSQDVVKTLKTNY